MKFIQSIVLLLASFSLFSCVSSSAVNQSSKNDANLSGEWYLVSLNNSSYQGPRITATFDNKDDRVSGFSGCNRYFAATNRQAGGRLSFGFIGSTKKLCANREVNQLESFYLRSLRKIHSYRLLGNQLILDGNSMHMVFLKSN